MRSKGIHGVIATPLHGDQGPFGAITVWSTRVDAFGPDDAALLETIAGQSAVALGRARLIEELGRSREALARRAEEERTLREIGGRLATIGSDPGDLLLRIVHEAARLLGAERARLDLVEPVQGKVIWTYPEDSLFTDAPVLDTPDDEEPIGLAGLSVREGRPVATGDYMADRRFKHYKEGDEGVQEIDLHSVITAPVIGEDGLVGVFQAGHRDRDAFGEDALRLLDALAGQASVALANARLVDRLATSQGALERTADAERALREIARRMMTHPGPGRAAPGRRRRGRPAARLVGRGHRPPRPGHGRGPLGARRGHGRGDPVRVEGAGRRRIGASTSRSASAASSSPRSTPPTTASPTARRTASSSTGSASGRSRSRR